MIDYLTHIDHEIFRTIHTDWANPIFDFVLPWLREAIVWVPLYGLFIYLSIKHYGLKGVYFIMATLTVVIICDRFSAGMMKPYFERLRPCHEPSLSQILRPLIDCGGQYGFISSHATNHFGLAVMFAYFFKQIASKPNGWLNYIFYIWAGLICYAQIYVGKHYFGDVLVGGLCGWVIGLIVLKIFQTSISLKK